MNRIQNSNVVSILGETMPEFILCKNKQVLKIRKKKHVMQTPCFNDLTPEEKYSKGKNLRNYF